MRSTLAVVSIVSLAALLVSSPIRAERQAAPSTQIVQISINTALPTMLPGLLRRPDGAGRFPAVVLLPICDGYARQLDEEWGAKLSSWGYVTLTIDSFSPRGIRNCDRSNAPTYSNPDIAGDAYRGLAFLLAERFVDPDRVAVVGFGWGAFLTMTAVERGAIERSSRNKFRAAVAFYPSCVSFKGIMTVPTLILIGERDDYARTEACRKMIAREDDFGMSRPKSDGAPVRLIAYPDAYHGFDIPDREAPAEAQGMKFNASAAEQSRDALREFLDSAVRDRL